MKYFAVLWNRILLQILLYNNTPVQLFTMIRTWHFIEEGTTSDPLKKSKASLGMRASAASAMAAAHAHGAFQPLRVCCTIDDQSSGTTALRKTKRAGRKQSYSNRTTKNCTTTKSFNGLRKFSTSSLMPQIPNFYRFTSSMLTMVWQLSSSKVKTAP